MNSLGILALPTGGLIELCPIRPNCPLSGEACHPPVSISAGPDSGLESFIRLGRDCGSGCGCGRGGRGGILAPCQPPAEEAVSGSAIWQTLKDSAVFAENIIFSAHTVFILIQFNCRRLALKIEPTESGTKHLFPPEVAKVSHCLESFGKSRVRTAESKTLSRWKISRWLEKYTYNTPFYCVSLIICSVVPVAVIYRSFSDIIWSLECIWRGSVLAPKVTWQKRWV